MKIPDTDMTLAEVLDQIPINLQFVAKNGFLCYLNKAAALRPANGTREVGVNIQDCHAHPESLENVGRILNDFRNVRKDPHYYINKEGNKSIMVPIFGSEGEFTGVFSYSHPAGYPKPDRTF